MRVALVQQRAEDDKASNVDRGLEALDKAARQGAELVCFSELAFERFHPQKPAAGDPTSMAEPVPGPTTEAFQARARELLVDVVLICTSGRATGRSTVHRSSTRTDGCPDELAWFTSPTIRAFTNRITTSRATPARPERIWGVIEKTASLAGASHELSDRLSRLTCLYCGTANPVGEGACIACGAPLGSEQPQACRNCGFVVAAGETKCPNCGAVLAG